MRPLWTQIPFLIALPVILLAASPAVAGAEETPLRTMGYRRGPEAEALAWQNEVRSELFKILKLEDLLTTKVSIPLNPKTLSSESKGDYDYKQIEISSTPTRRMTVVATFPNDAKTSRPAVVCIHGHGDDRSTPYERESAYKGFASELAARGFVTISANVGQHEVYEPDERILMGERLWDLMRCVDYLETLPEVDKGRIGCAGLSLGGEMAMWLGAMDTRIQATVSSGSLTVMDQMEQNHCMCWKFDGLRELVDFADIYSLIAPRALLCQNGTKEGETQFYVPIAKKAMEEIKPIYADLGAPERVELLVHPGGHEIDLASLLSFFEVK